MHWTLVTSLIGVGFAVFLMLRQRSDAVRARWWAVGPTIAFMPPFLAGLVQWPREGFVEAWALLQYGLLGSAFVATLSMVLVTFGPATDGRAVSLKSPVLALCGVVLVGLVSPLLAAWIAPVIVLGVCANELPRAASVIVRRRTVAVLGLVSVALADTLFVIDHTIRRAERVAAGNPGLVSMEWFIDFGPVLAISIFALAVALAASLSVVR